MSMKKRPLVSVESAGGQHFITVPSADAQDLHSHLKKSGIRTAWPEQCYTGFESITLSQGSDTEAVTKLLRDWRK